MGPSNPQLRAVDVSHVELFWGMPDFKAFMDRLGTFCRVLLFDKAGVGFSDLI